MNATVKEIVEILQKKMSNDDVGFFANLAIYKLAQIATNMHATVTYIGGERIPVNVYALSAALSGFAKGKSLKYVEQKVVNEFKREFERNVMTYRPIPILEAKADELAIAHGTDPAKELDAIYKQITKLPKYIYTFGSGSTPEGLKNLMTLLSMKETGAVTIEVDEIGSMLSANKEVLDNLLMCYTGDVEVLTEKGYQRFDQLDRSLKVLQYDADTKEVSFTKPLGYTDAPYKGDLYTFRTANGIDFSVSDEHDMLIERSNGKWTKKKPYEINTADGIILYGHAKDLKQHISNELRLQIAFQADGTKHKKKGDIRFAFQKKRKQERLRMLLNELSIPYSTYDLGTGQLEFHIDKNYDMEESKLLSDFIDLTTIDRTAAREILKELSLWDGSSREDVNVMYSSRIKANTELVQAICALAGYKAIHRIKDDPRSTKYSTMHVAYWNTEYRSKQTLPYIDKKSKGATEPARTISHHDGRIYCVTVETGNILIRRNGVQCIGGNSYDAGLIKHKLKATDSNDDIVNPVPTNLMAFGTPSKLFDGGQTEEMLMDFLDTGYGRRFIYAYADKEQKILSAEEKIKQLSDKSTDLKTETLSAHLKALADTTLFGREATLNDAANMALFEYEEKCLKIAEEMKSFQTIEKTEMQHRYFRVLKIAGVFAFIERSLIVNEEMVADAIELVEMSGDAFRRMMTREKNFVRLAKYIAEQGQEHPITLAELTSDLSGFFKGSEGNKRDLLTLAKSWGANNNVVIREKIVQDVSYFMGESLEPTDLNEIIMSTSTTLAHDYRATTGKWSKLKKNIAMDINITTHHFRDEHRTAENAIPGMNMVVLDVDDGVTIELAQNLLSDYEYIIYTTKRHTPSKHRFRVLMPLEVIIKLDEESHKSFMENIFNWLPFEVDEAAKDIGRKWQCYAGAEVFTNKGKLLDPTAFIPDTTKATETRSVLRQFSDVSRIEKHILATTKGRNNALLKIAMVHVDRGLSEYDIESILYRVNEKLHDPLSEPELRSTVLKTVRKKIERRG